MNSESQDGIQNYIHGHIQEHKQNESQGCDLGTNAVIKKCQWHGFPSRLGDSPGLSRPLPSSSVTISKSVGNPARVN